MKLEALNPKFQRAGQMCESDTASTSFSAASFLQKTLWTVALSEKKCKKTKRESCVREATKINGSIKLAK